MTLANYEDSNIIFHETNHQVCNFETNVSSSWADFLEYPLCVPQDALESLEGIKFWDDVDSISIDFMFSNTSEEQTEKDRNRTEQKPLADVWSIQTSPGSLLDLQNMSSLAEVPGNWIAASCSEDMIDFQNSTPNWNDAKIDIQNSTPNWSDLKIRERRCSHCDVRETPQWRAGPLGRNTLCNACGMRYKSGRLFPEYRPAASPTFDVNKHSNLHRRILKMRR